MSPCHTLADRAAEVSLKVGKVRPFDVTQGVTALTVIHILKGETTVENDKAG